MGGLRKKKNSQEFTLTVHKVPKILLPSIPRRSCLPNQTLPAAPAKPLFRSHPWTLIRFMPLSHYCCLKSTLEDSMSSQKWVVVALLFTWRLTPPFKRANARTAHLFTVESADWIFDKTPYRSGGGGWGVGDSHLLQEDSSLLQRKQREKKLNVKKTSALVLNDYLSNK